MRKAARAIASTEAEADAIAARLTRAKSCIVARHPQAALIEALIKRGVTDSAIEVEIPNGPSDSSIRYHRKGTCPCRRT